MPKKTEVNALMQKHNCSRTKANNMLRKRGNGIKTTDGSKKTKRRSIAK